MIKTKKKEFVRVMAIILAVALIVTGAVVTWADDWEGWNEETKEEAWVTYGMTEWSETGNFYYSEDGSVARSTVPDSFRNKTAGTSGYTYEALCQYVVNEHNTSSNNDQYVELLLSIVYVLNKAGNGILSSTGDDVACYYPYLTNTDNSITAERSVYHIYSRLMLCMRSYKSAHGSVSVFSNDEALGAVIQGVIYGSSYVKANSAYSQENAKDFSDNTSSFIADKAQGWNDFAYTVQNYYQSISCEGHYVVG